MDKKKFHIGDKGYHIKKITKEDVQKFAEVTEDFCPIHLDEEFAKTTKFGKPISHGLLVSNLLSTIMGMKMPGAGTIFLEQNVKFLLPTYPGDTITAELEIVDFLEKKNCYIVYFKGQCKNQKNELVVESTAAQMLPKEYFIME
jgi:3-hydroxybutyryl-CoA dehydratase